MLTDAIIKNQHISITLSPIFPKLCMLMQLNIYNASHS